MRSDHAHFRSLNAAITKLQSEDYQSPERARQTYATGLEGSKLDTDEKRSKKVYGKDGKVLYASLANLRRSLNKKNRKVAESVESAEYTELLESVLLALCDELELDPEELVEAYRMTPARSAVLDREQSKAKRYIKSHGAPKLKDGDYDGDIVHDEKGNSAGIMKKDSAQYPKKRAKFVNMKQRNDRINTLRASVGKHGKFKGMLDFDRKREQKSRRGTQAADRL